MFLVLAAWLAFWAPVAGQATGAAPASAVQVPRPSATATCPVCGMFVAKYPNWIATVVWRDGSAVHFDGAKDMFTYVLQLGKYAPGREAKDVVTITVTEFYDLRPIDARQAYYVIGSDVLGPMGREFIPLATRADATEFLRDHDATGILRFAEVSMRVVRDVDDGRR